jgi:hypothetical protein
MIPIPIALPSPPFLAATPRTWSCTLPTRVLASPANANGYPLSRKSKRLACGARRISTVCKISIAALLIENPSLACPREEARRRVVVPMCALTKRHPNTLRCWSGQKLRTQLIGSSMPRASCGLRGMRSMPGRGLNPSRLEGVNRARTTAQIFEFFKMRKLYFFNITR